MPFQYYLSIDFWLHSSRGANKIWGERGRKGVYVYYGLIQTKHPLPPLSLYSFVNVHHLPPTQPSYSYVLVDVQVVKADHVARTIHVR